MMQMIQSACLSFLLLAISASGCKSCNKKYENQLNGIEKLSVGEIFEMYKEEGTSLVDLNEEGRYEVFELNVWEIVLHNSDDETSYKRGIDRHTAMTFEEVKDYYNMDEVNEQAKQSCSATAATSTKTKDPLLQSDDAPSLFDWRDYNGVSPVKDQGSCGSCWTFSTVGCLESAYLIQYGSLATFSEQQLVDCAGDFENHGCSGGLPSQAFEYIHFAGGLASEESYPYFAKTRNCTVNADDYAISVSSGSVNITTGDEEELKNAVFSYGPTSVCFQVVKGFGSYTSGVYSSTTCNNTQMDVNHAVLAVGYGTDEDGLDYWILKNSWSDEWGDEGFFKMERGVNMCGIAMCNSHPYDITASNVVALN